MCLQDANHCLFKVPRGNLKKIKFRVFVMTYNEFQSLDTYSVGLGLFSFFMRIGKTRTSTFFWPYLNCIRSLPKYKFIVIIIDISKTSRAMMMQF